MPPIFQALITLTLRIMLRLLLLRDMTLAVRNDATHVVNILFFVMVSASDLCFERVITRTRTCEERNPEVQGRGHDFDAVGRNTRTFIITLRILLWVLLQYLDDLTSTTQYQHPALISPLIYPSSPRPQGTR